MVPRIGTEFAGYRIVALLGRGGMSIVYRAEDPGLGTTVALKILAPELAQDESFRERFVAESRLAAQLEHPNIITIYRAGEKDGVLFIAMRYVPSDLKKVFEANGALPPARLVGILGQVGGALDAAHELKLTHRDVKPANILLNAGGPQHPEIAYLSDFGVTKQAGTDPGQTVEGGFVGTPEYAAPEQLSGPVDGRADLYSFGCVAYEGLTGSPPFKGEHLAALLHAHAQADPPRPSEQVDGLPGAVDDVIARALAKEPDDRYESGTQFVSALAESLGATAATPTTVAPVPVKRKPPREPGRLRRRTLVALGLLGLLVLGAAAGVGVALATDTDQPSGLRTITQRETIQEPRGDTSAFDIELGNLIPPGIAETCEPVEPISDAFDSTLSCSGGVRGVPDVEYSHARSGDGLTSHLRARAAAAGVEFDLNDTLVTTTATCGDPEPSLRDYRAHGQTGHEITDSLTLQTEEAMSQYQAELMILGRVLCHRADGGRFWMEWTDNRSGVYTTASGRRAKDLILWWESSAGPMD
jgi:serine/threonine protein kinase